MKKLFLILTTALFAAGFPLPSLVSTHIFLKVFLGVSAPLLLAIPEFY